MKWCHSHFIDKDVSYRELKCLPLGHRGITSTELVITYFSHIKEFRPQLSTIYHWICNWAENKESASLSSFSRKTSCEAESSQSGTLQEKDVLTRARLGAKY